MAQWNKNTQDFLNQERSLFEVPMIATKDGNPVSVENPFPVSLGSSNITINGDITIPDTISVASTPGNPVHTHITQIGSSGLLEDNGIPYMPVGIGTTQNLNLSYLPVGISSLLNTVSISNTSFNVSGSVSVANTVSVSGTVNIGTIPEVEIKNDTGNPIPVSGNISVSPSNADAFGRTRVSNPLTLFDSSHRYRDNNLWTQLVVGTGSTVGFVTTQGLINIGIGTTAGCSVIRETTKTFAYQPGKSLLIMNTFVPETPKENLRQRVGYFGADNGIYFEIAGIGSTSVSFVERSLSIETETRVPQTQWNIDKLDGTGASGITLDPSKAQILWTDIEWLGLGTVRVGFVIDGAFIHCHSFHHANKIQTTYMTTACLPLRYEISNTGVTTSTSTLKQVCSTVISEGGYELRGLQQGVGTTITSPIRLATAGTYYPIISLRLKSNPNRLDGIAILTAISVMGITNNSHYNWQVRASANTTGSGTWVSSGVDSSIEYKINGGVVSGGRILAEGYSSASNQAVSAVDILKEALFKFQLERDGLTGTPYELTLVAAGSAVNSDIHASLDWEEVSR